MATIKYNVYVYGVIESINLTKDETRELESKGYIQVDDETWVIKKDDYYYVTRNTYYEELKLNSEVEKWKNI